MLLCLGEKFLSKALTYVYQQKLFTLFDSRLDFAEKGYKWPPLMLLSTPMIPEVLEIQWALVKDVL